MERKIYFDVNAKRNGNGTVESPFNSFDDAVKYAKVNQPCMIMLRSARTSNTPKMEWPK